MLCIIHNSSQSFVCTHSKLSNSFNWQLYQVLALWVTVDLEVMVMKGSLYSPNRQGRNLSTRCFNVISWTLVGVGGLSTCKDAVSVFYSHSRLGWQMNEQHWIVQLMLNRNTRDHLTEYKQMSSCLFKILSTNSLFTNHISLIYIWIKWISLYWEVPVV